MLTYPDLTAIIARGDRDEMAATLWTLWGKLSFDGPQKKRTTPKAANPDGSWLTPARDAWEAVMGAGSFQYGAAAKWLAPLRSGYPDVEIGERLGFYLRSHKREGKMQYVSLKRFAETIGAYAPNELAFPEDV